MRIANTKSMIGFARVRVRASATSRSVPSMPTTRPCGPTICASDRTSSPVPHPTSKRRVTGS